MTYWAKKVSACGVCHSVKCCCHNVKQIPIYDVIRIDASCPKDFRFPDAETNPTALKAFTGLYKAQLDDELSTYGDRIVEMHGALHRITSAFHDKPGPSFASLGKVTPWIQEPNGLSRYLSDVPHSTETRVASFTTTAAVRVRDYSTEEREALSWAECPRAVAESAAGSEAMMAWCDIQLLTLGYRL
ncbi:hypothetical protein [Stutzerimonas stutzeri]|uniref:hypothetical protein n=1 Tax=Stutzerimonas stutzeri TaxID=316 RepID=UPI0015E405BB|nr:hypothetical protein [Stutzerimonas stutzeri]MBA1280433.1 hypothetical protein [Stutzerimonas stutzeri]